MNIPPREHITAESISGLTTTVVHRIPSLRVRIGLDPMDGENAKCKFTLTASDGSYSQTLTIQDDSLEGDQYVDLVFPDVRVSKAYTLTVDSGTKTGRYNIFEAVPYEDIVKSYSLLEDEGELFERDEKGATSHRGEEDAGQGEVTTAEATESADSDDDRLVSIFGDKLNDEEPGQ
jgi:hypothetical protein